LLKLVNKNTAVHWFFSLLHSALTNVNTTFDFNNVAIIKS